MRYALTCPPLLCCAAVKAVADAVLRSRAGLGARNRGELLLRLWLISVRLWARVIGSSGGRQWSRATRCLLIQGIDARAARPAFFTC